MSGNGTYRLQNTALLASTAIEAPEVVTSDDLDELLEPAFRRFGMRGGKVELLSGVRSRRWWPAGADHLDAAAEAARAALDEAGVDPAEVGLLVNGSVTRPHLEPGLAATVHHRLGLPTSCLDFDVTNACLGIVNSLQIAGAMIEAGHLDYALIVASEDARTMQEATIDQLLQPDSTTAQFKSAFATLTLGCGAVAMLIGRADRHDGGHRILGGVTRAGTQHHQLCVGGMDGMTTDAGRLFVEGLALATETWKDAQGDFDWYDMDWYVAHQTSVSHIRGLCDAVGLDVAKFPTSLPEYGNIGPAALPFTLAQHVPHLRRGDRVLLMGIGSGLNTAYTELSW